MQACAAAAARAADVCVMGAGHLISHLDSSHALPHAGHGTATAGALNAPWRPQ